MKGLAPDYWARGRVGPKVQGSLFIPSDTVWVCKLEFGKPSRLGFLGGEEFVQSLRMRRQVKGGGSKRAGVTATCTVLSSSCSHLRTVLSYLPVVSLSSSSGAGKEPASFLLIHFDFLISFVLTSLCTE